MGQTSLLRVAVVFRRQPNTAALQDLDPVISSFLGPPPSLSLSDACKLNSPQLLDWIWASSCTATENRTSSWSLNNFLRSEPLYYQWQFSLAIRVAVRSGNLEIVEWLLTHFSCCEVCEAVVEDAADHGKLGILKKLQEHEIQVDNIDIKQRKIDVEGSSLFKAGHVIHWSGRAITLACYSGNREMILWLLEHTPTENYKDDLESVIESALGTGDMELVRRLLPPGRIALDYARYCNRPEIIEWELDCGYLKRDSFSAVCAINSLVPVGRLDLIKQIAAQLDPPPVESDWPRGWRDAMGSACACGDARILQWLIEHPMGPEELYEYTGLSRLLETAAYSGHVEVMQCLYSNGFVSTYAGALLVAVRNDHIAAVRWLIENFPSSEVVPHYCVMNEAARHGRLELLQYMHNLDPLIVPGYDPARMVYTSNDSASKQIDEPRYDSDRMLCVSAADDRLKMVRGKLTIDRQLWRSTDPMDEAAANGELEVVKWLHCHRREGCTTGAMDFAAANGHLEVVRWLDANRTEGCTNKAIDGAARNGHVEVVKWLFTHTTGACTADAMEYAVFFGHVEVVKLLHANSSIDCSTEALDYAAGRGHFKVVEWMCINRSEVCTVEAMKAALQSGHLQLACYLQEYFPKYSPAKVKMAKDPRKLFDGLLYLHVNHKHNFTRQFVQNVTKTCSCFSSSYMKTELQLVKRWLEDNHLTNN